MATSQEAMARIVKLLEFYFSDSNLRDDKFLRKHLDSNNDGWVAINLLLTFKRLQELTTECHVVAESVKQSTLLELDPEGLKIRRKTPYVPVEINPACFLSIKNLPVDLTLDSLETFFDEINAKTLSIRMKKDRTTGSFNGCIIAEFASADSAQAILKEGLSFCEQPLEVSPATFTDGKLAKKKEDSLKDKADSKVSEKVSCNSLVKVSNLTPECSFQEIKDALKDSFPVAYVDIDSTTNSAIIRLVSHTAEDVISANPEGISASSGNLQVSNVSSEEYEAFLSKLNNVKKHHPGHRGSSKRFKRH